MLQIWRAAAVALAAFGITVGPLAPHLHLTLPARPVQAVTVVAPTAFLGSERDDAAAQILLKQQEDQAAADRDAAAAAAAQAAEARSRAGAEEAAQAAAAAARQQAASQATSVANIQPGSVQDVIRRAFEPYGAAAVAWGLRVARCESGYNPNAVNPNGFYGLFQFYPPTFRATPYGNQNIFDPYYNAAAAAWKYSVSGGGAWSCN